MNRPGITPQSIRGMPGFGGQQQQQQPTGRSVSSRVPNGKLANNGSGWAFGTGMPMGGGGGGGGGGGNNMQNPSRQMGGNVSFAQSLGGSQPSTPLDLSEFPSLSNNPQLGNSNPSSMWSTSGSTRNASGPVPRNQSTPFSAQSTQEELYPPSSSSRGGFRFGSQGNVGQPTQTPSNPPDEFPPLNRNANGEIGGERSANMMSSLGLGGRSSGASGPMSGNRAAAGNGLLNALSENSRPSDAPSPSAPSAPGAGRISDDDRKGSLGMALGAEEGPHGLSAQEARDSASGMPNEEYASKSTEGAGARDTEAQDPLAGMAPIDKFGIKGLRTMMSNYPSYSALIQGMDPNELGLNVNSAELISPQIYSLFDDTPPRPAVPNFRLPECYRVTNVQPIETKIQSFNEETLFWIFYSCPQDHKQQLAAYELHSRNWRWHKKLHIWLTKDELMTPQSISPTHEQGYYVIWDIRNWRKERRELTLHYEELETSLARPPAAP